MHAGVSEAQSLPGLTFTCHKYGDHELQRIGVWQRQQPQDRTAPSNGRWVIFLHGGAWRDSRVDLYGFIPTIKRLLQLQDPVASQLQGFASIDYRLSASPNFPQDPSNTPSTSLRQAKHPEHILDVRAALRFAATEYGIGSEYILIGHSVGATMAYQLLMGQDVFGEDKAGPIPLPTCIIGIAGIYDLIGIDERHGGQYAAFIAGALGDSKDVWERLSPACFTGSFAQNGAGHFSLLAASSEDSLVDGPEILKMNAKLTSDGVVHSVERGLVGDHDFVWQDGAQIAELVVKALSQLQKTTT